MARQGYDEVALVTGFPSFEARRLLTHLVASEPRTLVYAVVKAKLAGEADECVASLEPRARERVVLLEGDVAHIDLGLSGAEFKLLAAEVDRIYHLAQISYLGIDRATAREVNVGGVREVLELAREARGLRSLLHWSSAFVAGDRQGVVREDELSSGQRFRNVVEETKALGEKLMRAAQPSLPITIVRPAMVVGDSHTGEVDRFDGAYLALLLMLTSPPDIGLPLPGKGDVPLHLVPIDYVVAAAHALARDDRARGRTFHLVDPQPKTAREAFSLMAKAAGSKGPVGALPSQLAKALLSAPYVERFARSPRALIDHMVTRVRFDDTNTSAMLAGTGVACPSLETYVDVLVSYVRARLSLERDEHRADADDEAPAEQPS